MPRGERRHSKASEGGSSMDTSFNTVGGHPYYHHHQYGGGAGGSTGTGTSASVTGSGSAASASGSGNASASASASGTGTGSGQHQHGHPPPPPPHHQMSHHRGRQHSQRAPSPMMVSSPSPPFLPPHYGDPNLPPYYPMQQTANATSSGGQHHHQHQHQHQMPIHSAQPPQPLNTGSTYHQSMPYYPIQQSYQPPPPPPPPLPANNTPPNIMASIGGVTGGTGDNIMGGAMTMSGTTTGGGGVDPLVQQDIERGLRIDFYAETDAMLLASWASFFRDQFVEARQELARASYDRNAETYRRATHFVERVETKILKTNAMKLLFRRHPLTHINDPIFVDACYRAIIDYLMRNPPFDGFTFGNPTWRDYMWFRAGLMKVVEDGRTQFLEWYTKQIWETLDMFIQPEIDGISGEKGLLEASISGMRSEPSYNQAKQFYIRLFNEVLSKIDRQQEGAGAAIGTETSIVGKRVREVFHLDEEALILSAIRSYVTTEARKSMGTEQEGKAPTPQDVGNPVEGVAVVLPKILATAVEISQLLANQELSCTVDTAILILNDTNKTVTATIQDTIPHMDDEPNDDGDKIGEGNGTSPTR